MKKRYYHQRTLVEIKAAIFSLCLLAGACLSIIGAFASTGPMVLGTEMNTNGMVEYMCLGNGCENMADFAWIDR